MLFSSQERKLLERLSKQSGMTMTDVITHSMRLYEFMRHEKHKKVLVKKGTRQKEILVL
jgi:hypothetical protein